MPTDPENDCWPVYECAPQPDPEEPLNDLESELDAATGRDQNADEESESDVDSSESGPVEDEPVPPEAPDVPFAPPQPPSSPAPRITPPGQALEILVAPASLEDETPAAAASEEPPAIDLARGDQPAPAAIAAFSMAPAPSPALAIAAIALFSAGAVVYAAFAVFYNRLSRDRILQHSLRRGLLDEITRAPGLGCAEVAKILGIHYTTAEHHLRILQRWKFVRSGATSLGRRFFSVDVAPKEEAWRHLAILRQNEAFLRAAVVRDAFRPIDLARELGVPKSTASYRARALVRAGVLERRGTRLAVVAAAHAAFKDQRVDPPALGRRASDLAIEGS